MEGLLASVPSFEGGNHAVTAQHASAAIPHSGQQASIDKDETTDSQQALTHTHRKRRISRCAFSYDAARENRPLFLVALLELNTHCRMRHSLKPFLGELVCLT